MESCQELEKKNLTQLCTLCSATRCLQLLTYNVQGSIEAVPTVTTTFQSFAWPQLGCLTLGDYLIIGSFYLLGPFAAGLRLGWINVSENSDNIHPPNAKVKNINIFT